MDRLQRSCEGIRLPLPIPKPTLVSEILKLVQHCEIQQGWVYLQVTRGPAPRNHIYPAKAEPTTLFYVRALEPLPPAERTRPYSLLSVPDDRWNKCWIKAIALLPNVLAKNSAAEAGADEAIFIHNGNVTEGSASNLFMVQSGRLITHPIGEKVLPGVTRDVLLDCAKSLGIPVEERAMPLPDAKRSDEVFITSSTRELVWVNRWDGETIADGNCGKICCKLHEEYRRRVNTMRDER
jgi:D-alanine transaminase